MSVFCELNCYIFYEGQSLCHGTRHPGAWSAGLLWRAESLPPVLTVMSLHLLQFLCVPQGCMITSPSTFLLWKMSILTFSSDLSLHFWTIWGPEGAAMYSCDPTSWLQETGPRLGSGPRQVNQNPSLGSSHPRFFKLKPRK